MKSFPFSLFLQHEIQSSPIENIKQICVFDYTKKIHETISISKIKKLRGLTFHLIKKSTTSWLGLGGQEQLIFMRGVISILAQ
jgi:hypothetical protein